MAEADLSSLSLKELKSLIAEAGLSSADCLDKSDLRERAAQARARLRERAPAPAAAASRLERRFGSLQCLVLGHPEVLAGRASADLCVLVLHGLGATSSDFADLPAMLANALGQRKVCYVLPQAPAVPMLGYAWWQIDVMAFLTMQSSGPEAMARMIRQQPEGLDTCRESLAQLLREVRQFAAAASGKLLHPRKLLLGGFSQGAMTSMDAALQMPVEERVGGVAFLSGAPIVVEQWAEKLQALKRSGSPPLPVLVTHGMADSTLPYACSGWVKELLSANGADVTFVSHNGGHDLGGPQVVKALTDFVLRIADEAAQF